MRFSNALISFMSGMTRIPQSSKRYGDDAVADLRWLNEDREITDLQTL